MKSNAWYVKFPLDAYAMGPIRFNKEKTERELRQYVREWLGYKRLTGVQVWKAY
jgi:hypothetical protein